MRLLILLFSCSLMAQDIPWVAASSPGNASKSQLGTVYDGTHGGMLYFTGSVAGAPENNGIYSNAIWFQPSSTLVQVRLWYSGVTGFDCGPVVGGPINGHPMNQIAWNIDAAYLLKIGGLCSGTGENFNIPLTWKFTHNGTTGSWSQVVTSTCPGGNGGCAFPVSLAGAAMKYDPHNHVTWLFGGNTGSGTTPHQIWAFCDSAVSAVGCTNAGDWNLVSHTGVIHEVAGAVLEFDPTHNLLVYYGGYDSATNHNEVDLFDPSTLTVTNLSPSGTPPATPLSWPNAAWDNAGRLIVMTRPNAAYALTGIPSSPAWVALTASGPYDPSSYNSICSASGTGGGLQCGSFAYDPSVGRLAGYYTDSSSGAATTVYATAALAPPGSTPTVATAGKVNFTGTVH